MITYKFPIRPSPEQQRKLWDHSCLLNRLYNHFIELEQTTYTIHHKYLSAYDLCSTLPMYKQEHPEYKELYSQSLQRVPFRVHAAYIAFFNNPGKVSPPSFRSCKNFFNIVYPQTNIGYTLHQDEGYVSFTRYGVIPVYFYRKIKGTVKQVSIHYDGKHWFLLVVADTEYVRQKSKHDEPFWLGIDLGTTNLVTTSEGEKIPGPKHYKYFDPRIDALKSKRDHLKKGSRKHKHLSLIIRKLCKLRSNKMKNDLHHISKDLSSTCDVVCVENLHAKSMSKTPATGRNKSIRNAYWGMFVAMLMYKVKKVFLVNPKNTSKSCCYCQSVQSLNIKQRTYKCPHCGIEIDRDHNAALNILHLGYAIAAKQATINTPIGSIVTQAWMSDRTLTCLGTGLWSIQRSC